MKKLKMLLVMLLMFVVAMPMVNAEEATTKSKVNVYLFKGEGCGYCANALTFFESIKEEYGKYFNLVEYEVWYNKDNSDLMYDVAEYMGASITGVPFIVIGNEFYPGFNDSISESIKKQIVSEYNLEESKRVDVVKMLESGVDPSGSRNKKILIVSIVAVIGLVSFVVLARHGIEEEVVVSLNADKKDLKVEKEAIVEKTTKQEKVVEEVVKEEKVRGKDKSTKKSNTAKKEDSNSKKKTTSTKKKTTKTNTKKKN